jgi:NAD(P)-dependent dehydrogenase (short-subunit alcohol dehydrogenase family)
MSTQSSFDVKTIVLTGCTSGLGYECARTIAAFHPNWHLIIAGRSQSQGIQVMNTLKAQTKNQYIQWVPTDLASLNSIRSFVQTITNQNLPPLHAIVCNAGLQISSGTTYTQDGFEMTFGVNCLSHFLLVNLLLRHVVPPARIIFVSSTTHDSAYESPLSRFVPVHPPCYQDPKALAWPERYPGKEEQNESTRSIGMRRYSTAKLCVLYYAYELAHRLEKAGYNTPEHPITVNTFNPGFTYGTGLVRDSGPIMQFVWRRGLPLFKWALPTMHSPSSSGQSLARLILDTTLEKISGRYFSGREERASSQESYDRARAQELWDESAALVQLRPDETIFS